MLVFMTVPKGWSFHRVSTLLSFMDSHSQPSSTCSCFRLQQATLPLLVLHKEVHPRQNVAFFQRLSGGRRDEETAKNSQKRHYLHPLSLRFLDVVKGRGLYIISHLSLMVWSRAVEVVLGLFDEVFTYLSLTSDAASTECRRFNLRLKARKHWVQ